MIETLYSLDALGGGKAMLLSLLIGAAFGFCLGQAFFGGDVLAAEDGFGG